MEKQNYSKAQLGYILAKAKYEAVKSLVYACKKDVLEKNVFLEEDGKKERITEPISDFRMSEEDFAKYCKLTHAIYIEKELEVKDWDTCPEYIYSNKLNQAEKELIEWGNEKIKKLPEYKPHAKEIENLIKVAGHNLKIRSKLIGLTLTLETN